MQEKKGYVSFVLHAHLPFIHHPESDDYLEESWLYEAISETYLPLLRNFKKLAVDDKKEEIIKKLYELIKLFYLELEHFRGYFFFYFLESKVLFRKITPVFVYASD